MSNNTARIAIEAELRSLRKAYGRLDSVKLATAGYLVRALGNRDVAVALTRLADLAVEYSDRDVDAAMASIGLGVRSEAALDRLAEHSERHQVDPRTVRRWSDAGITKLTQLIMGKAPWIQPRARQVIEALTDGEVRYRLRLAVPPVVRMGAPTLQINGREVEVGMPEIASLDRQQDLASAPQRLGSLEDLPLRITLAWTGEKYPAYESVTSGTPDVYFSSRLGFHSLITLVRRSGSALRDGRADPELRTP